MEGTIGNISMFGGTFAPRSWAYCDGQLLAVSANPALFSILGTTYGGDGRTTFGMPDLRGRMAIGPGNGPGLPSYREGQKGGATTTTLLTSNLPAQSIKLRVANDGTTVENATTTSYIGGQGNKAVNGLNSYPVSMYKTGATSFTDLNCITGGSGGGIPISIQNPFLAVPYIICQYGIFPSRN